MGKIIRLDPLLSNRIAAGEVVERIANVVKELVENSIDANSTKIEVLLEESGLKQIQVFDNGSGMDKEDALLCFERHATSKIKNEYDLFHIRSLGFRGEALPSIASVARVELETCADGINGTKVIVDNGNVEEVSLSSSRKGTMVSVTKLFYQTPARFKYLKSPQTELSNIDEMMNKFAIAYPEIAFSLYNQGKIVFQTAGNGNTLDVLAKNYGIEVAKSMRRFSGKSRDYEITGFFSNPIQNRSSKNYISIFVNKRHVRNPKITSAIIESYDQLIPINRYPIVVMNINVDSSLIDVNIHPTKQDVKFSEEDELQRLITSTIRQKLELVEVVQPVKKEVKKEAQLSFEQPYEKPIEDTMTAQEPVLFEREELPPVEGKSKHVRPSIEYIGQYHGTFLLFQNEQGMYLLDQHAAAERIRYERYLKRMSQPEKNIYYLLVPMRIELSTNIVLSLLDHLQQIKDFGITLKQDSENSFQIMSTPAWFPRGFEVLYTEDVLMTFVEEKDLQVSAIRDELAKSLACKHSLKANAYVSKMEAEQILHDLYQCDNPYTCPHGRPILVLFEQLEIDKYFKRVMS